MVKLDNAQFNYNYTAEIDSYSIAGTCTFSDDKMLQANGTVEVLVENPETEGDVKTVGSFNYNCYEDEKANYSFYVDEAIIDDFSKMVITLIAELKDSKK